MAQLTKKQQEATDNLLSKEDKTHLLLYGGSRSGKTAVFIRSMIVRALKAPESRHGAFRFAFSHAKQSIGLDTYPKILRTFFPGVIAPMNKTEWYATFPNGSELWLGGLDDQERTEKVLGKEFASIFLNECSQISWEARNMVLTRLAQKCMIEIGKGKQQKIIPLKTRMYYDCNPPSKGHWTYKLFIQKQDPESRIMLPDPENYGYMQMNPEDNSENIDENYINILRGMNGRMQKRFLRGEFSDENPNQLFPDTIIDKYRIVDGDIPQMVRIVVACDPSGTDDDKRVEQREPDEIGIIVVGLGTNGHGYVFEDCSINAGPGTWGAVVASAYDRHKADCAVGEKNFGGGMVGFVIKTHRPGINYKLVTATRGKVVRAEPFSSLYEQGKIHHIGQFTKLEEELGDFNTTGYTGARSPNRADALIWALTELFPGIINSQMEVLKASPVATVHHWNKR